MNIQQRKFLKERLSLAMREHRQRISDNRDKNEPDNIKAARKLINNFNKKNYSAERRAIKPFEREYAKLVTRVILDDDQNKVAKLIKRFEDRR